MTLVAAYSFDSGAVVDAVGTHNGTLFNSPTFPAGHTSLGIQFSSASSEYAEIADHVDFTLGTAWTMMCWFKPTTLVAGELIAKPNQWWFSTNGTGQIVHGFYYSVGGNTNGVSSVATMTPGTWYHVACRYDGTTYSVVINGVQNNSSTDAGVASGKTMADTVDKVRLGSWAGATEFQNGVLDDVRIYKQEWLSDAAITTLMNTPVTGGATAPTAPLSPLATPGDAQVALSWSAPASNGGSAITGYKIYRSTTSGAETLLASPAGTGTSYTDSTAANGTTYYYKISAVNAIGESALSSEVSATPSAPVLIPATRTYKRFYGPTLLGTSAATLYTVPASTTSVVRHVHVSNPSGAPVDFSLSIGTNAAGTRVWDAQPIPADDVLDHYQDFSLTAGEILQGFAGSAATLNLVIDGYELDLVPDVPPPATIYPSDTLFPSDTSP